MTKLNACIVLVIAATCAPLPVVADDSTTGNMKPNATSTQHPSDETPQHSQPPTAGDKKLQQDAAEAERTSEQKSDTGERTRTARAPADEQDRSSEQSNEAQEPRELEGADAEGAQTTADESSESEAAQEKDARR